MRDDDDLRAPTLTPPPATSPLRGRIWLGAAIVVSVVSSSCYANGEAPPLRDAGPDAGTTDAPTADR